MQGNHSTAMIVLLMLQGLAVLFVALHNWVPLGSLNNVRGLRVAFPTGKLVATTLLNLTPVAVGFVGTALYMAKGHPRWIFTWVGVVYLLACYGSFKAWWMPYLFRADAALVARYEVMYAGTHSFLPMRNGLRPDTLHVYFDGLTLGILICVAVVRFG